MPGLQGFSASHRIVCASGKTADGWVWYRIAAFAALYLCGYLIRACRGRSVCVILFIKHRLTKAHAVFGASHCARVLAWTDLAPKTPQGCPGGGSGELARQCAAARLCALQSVLTLPERCCRLTGSVWALVKGCEYWPKTRSGYLQLQPVAQTVCL